MSDRTCNRCNRRLVGRQKKFCSQACANRTHMRAYSEAKRTQPWPSCTVADCMKRARSRSAELCPMHYHRLYRYGTLETTKALVERGERPPAQVRTELRGQRFGTLTVLEPDGEYWECQCDCGEKRRTRIGDLNRTGDASTCGIKANHLSDTADYSAAHTRVRNLRGSAADFRCVDCGRQAYHWSYDHADPDERTSRAERTVGVAFSLNPCHYQPRCVPCHKTFDLGRINGTLSPA